MGTSWSQSDICGNVQYVRGSYMTRNGKYSVFASDSDVKIFFSEDYGQTYNYIGAFCLFECILLCVDKNPDYFDLIFMDNMTPHMIRS